MKDYFKDFEENETLKGKVTFNNWEIILKIHDDFIFKYEGITKDNIPNEFKLRAAYSNQEKESQLLLLPDIINLTHKEMDIAKENMDIFKKAGFELEEFGDNTIKLTGVPNICIDLDTKENSLICKRKIRGCLLGSLFYIILVIV